eukprot:764108-Hanusia_phi.AAC.2
MLLKPQVLQGNSISKIRDCSKQSRRATASMQFVTEVHKSDLHLQLWSSVCPLNSAAVGSPHQTSSSPNTSFPSLVASTPPRASPPHPPISF